MPLFKAAKQHLFIKQQLNGEKWDVAYWFALGWAILCLDLGFRMPASSHSCFRRLFIANFSASDQQRGGVVWVSEDGCSACTAHLGQAGWRCHTTSQPGQCLSFWLAWKNVSSSQDQCLACLPADVPFPECEKLYCCDFLVQLCTEIALTVNLWYFIN